MIVRDNRIANEWQLLIQFAALNPDRIQEIQKKEDGGFTFLLKEVPSLSQKPERNKQLPLQTEHRVAVEFPRYYPSVPCEVFLSVPVFHPNIDPINGFVCLWNQHRVANNIEVAIVKLAAVLAWELMNADAPHIMQPEALEWYRASTEERSPLPLQVTPWNRITAFSIVTPPRRRRLSL